jgi:hypothetical protein
VWSMLKAVRHQTLEQLPKFAVLIDGDSAFPCFTCTKKSCNSTKKGEPGVVVQKGLEVLISGLTNVYNLIHALTSGQMANFGFPSIFRWNGGWSNVDLVKDRPLKLRFDLVSQVY